MGFEGSFWIEPNRPEVFCGKRDFVTVSIWVYKIEQYFMVSRIMQPGLQVSDELKVVFAATYLSGEAAVWWFSLVQRGSAPMSWDGFKEALQREFIPSDSLQVV